MLRTVDLLLTFAAVCLLLAALDGKSRVRRASAAETGAGFANQQQLRTLMSKVKLMRSPVPTHRAHEPEGPASEHRHQDSYSYYANAESAGQNPQEHAAQARSQSGHLQPQEVKIEFLRSSPLMAGAQPQNNSSAQNSLYLLSTSRTNNQQPLAAAASLDAGENEIDVGEQQQQPPFTMFPPGGATGQYNGQSLPANNIRDILANYQRAYNQQPNQGNGQNSGQLPAGVLNALAQGGANGNRLPNQQQIAELLRPPVAQQQQHQSPPRAAAGVGAAQPTPQGQPQQPFTPLQFLTNPLQAFLPGLQPAQQTQPASGGAQTGSAKSQPPAQPATPQLPNLLNPFGLGVGQQQQPGGGLPTLQSLYQQMPLYQAMMAARQRQEALEAAQRMRQQQLNQQHQAPARQPQAPLRPPYGGFGAQQPPPAAGQNGWQQPHQPAPQPESQPPPNQSGNPVQFDDDNDSGNQQQAKGAAQPNTNDAGAQRQPEEPSGNSDSQQDNGGGGEDNGAGQQDGDNQQQQQPQEQPPAKAEEEDPDLKQFQNLANGGDSFTDLFPPGILSNNDISDIKKQQEEQARKQEQEERQKQMQQQHQQQQPAPQYEQPVNQFANDNAQNQNQQPDGANPSEQPDANQANEQPEDDGQENQDDDQSDDQGGQEEGDGSGTPVAAALTSKAAGAESGKTTTRAAKSPGVEYAS